MSDDVQQARVFIVDDDPDFAMVLAEVLADEGLSSLRFSDGRAALAALAVETPRLIITDLVMPVMSGQQLLRALRDNSRWRCIPVVVLTGGNDTAAPLRLDVPVIYKPDVMSLLSMLRAIPGIADGERRINITGDSITVPAAQ